MDGKWIRSWKKVLEENCKQNEKVNRIEISVKRESVGGGKKEKKQRIGLGKYLGEKKTKEKEIRHQNGRNLKVEK